MPPSPASPKELFGSPHPWWSSLSAWIPGIRKRPASGLPTHSGHVTQPTIKEHKSRDNSNWGWKATDSPMSGKLSHCSSLQSKKESIRTHSSERSFLDRCLQLEKPFVYLEGTSSRGQTQISFSTDPVKRPLIPRTPTQGDRYNRDRVPPDARKGSEIAFNSGPRPIQKVSNIPDAWVEDVHPEGQLLYSCVLSSRNLNIRVHTDLALRKKENHLIIQNAASRLSESLDSSLEFHNAGLVDSDVEACILVREDHPDECGYYLVNHQDQTVFWLEKVMARDVDMWAYDEDIYHHKLAEQYWRHVTDFPHHCCLSPKVWEQLGPLMLLGAVDKEYCEDSTAPRDVQTLGRLEAFWRRAGDQRDIDVNKAACNWICARLWYDFVTSRDQNFWGTDYARLERTIKVGEDPRPSQGHQQYPWFTRFVCFLILWEDPLVAMRILDDAWPGGIIYPTLWREMMGMFLKEWDKVCALSAVTFVGATAFLAIQAFRESPDPALQDSSLFASLATCCGISCCAFSVASLISAVNLKRDFGGKIAQDVHEAGDYLRELYSDFFGYIKWYIRLSLPRILFQWSTASFCAGLVILAFQLHRNRIWFFYTEILVMAILAVAVVAGRYPSPSRIRLSSVPRRALSKTRNPPSGAERAGSLVPNRHFKRESLA